MKLRSLLALALFAPAAVLAAPAAKAPAAKTAAAPAKSAAAPASSSPMQGLEVGGFIGYETDDVSGLSLRLDAELPFRDLSPQVKLSFVGSIGYSRLTDSQFGVDFTANVLKFVPAARFTMPVNPQFSVFGDAGLGLAYVGAKVEHERPVLRHHERDRTARSTSSCASAWAPGTTSTRSSSSAR